MGAWKNGGVEIIANDQGSRTTPSYVAFTDTGRLIGDAAENKSGRQDSGEYGFDAKRPMGRKVAGPAVQADIQLWPLKTKSGTGDKR